MPQEVDQLSAMDQPLLRADRGQADFRELMVVGAGLLAFLWVILIASGAVIGFSRWFWLDEVCTILIARQDAHQIVHLLKEAIDSNLPGLYIILKGLHGLGLPLDEVPVRLVASVAMWLTLVGLYANLRLVYPRLPSLIATVSLLTATALIRFTFEARFYSYWVMIIVWESYFLIRVCTERRFSWRHIVLMVLTAMAILIHYYGIFALGFLLAGDFIGDRRPLGVKIRSRWPVYCGFAVLPLIPYFFYYQHAVLSGVTWVDPMTLYKSLRFLGSTLLGYPISVVLVLLVGWCCLPAGRSMQQRPRISDLRGFPLGGLAAMMAFPVFLVLFSWFVEPRLHVRYGIPGLLGAAVIVAALANRLPRVLHIVALVALSGMAFYQYRKIPGETDSFQGELTRNLNAIVATGVDAPILYEGRLEFYPCIYYRPELAGRSYYLMADVDHEDPKILVFPPNVLSFEIRAHARVAQEFPAYQSMKMEQATQLPAFFVRVGGDSTNRGDVDMNQLMEARFPGYHSSTVDKDVYLLKKIAPMSAVPADTRSAEGGAG